MTTTVYSLTGADRSSVTRPEIVAPRGEMTMRAPGYQPPLTPTSNGASSASLPSMWTDFRYQPGGAPVSTNRVGPNSSDTEKLPSTCMLMLVLRPFNGAPSKFVENGLREYVRG